MKKTFISMLLIASCCSVANAQLVVDRLGKAAIGYESNNKNDTLYSDFTIGSRGASAYTAYIKTDKRGALRIQRTTDVGTSSDQYGIHVTNASSAGAYNYGIYSKALGNVRNRRNVGVMGTATSDSTGYEAGVVGIVDANDNNGVGVLGSTSGISKTISRLLTAGQYAGYFMGDTRVTGTLTAGVMVTSSDYRLKENIRSLSSSDGCLAKLMDMNVVEFNNKQREYDLDLSALESIETETEELGLTSTAMGSSKESVDRSAYWYEDDSPIIKNKHYGLIAQELKEVYPDLVVESQDGYLAINYLEIIPLLIRSVQELKAELDASKNGNAPVQKAQARTTDATGIDAVVTTLYQNTPNPFTESTLIRCDVAEEVVKADLYIYNMNGEQITEFAITERGETSVIIDGGSLNAGMYLYALIADGQVIDTKRMILTK